MENYTTSDFMSDFGFDNNEQYQALSQCESKEELTIELLKYLTQAATCRIKDIGDRELVRSVVRVLKEDK